MILLDTHTWVWYASNSPKLSNTARQAIFNAEKLAVHIISCWEIAMLVEKGRIKFDKDIEEWITLALSYPKITLLPFEPSVAILAARLPNNFHGDPADRFLAASCLTYQIPLITKDELIRQWGQIEAVW